MSAYTPSLRLLVPTVGGDYNKWGNYLNKSIDLIEDAISGIAPVNLTGLNTYTLTSVQGDVDEARKPMLVFSGTPSATVTIVVPAVPKHYFVLNMTNQPLTIGIAGGSTATISANSFSFVYCDGVKTNAPLDDRQFVRSLPGGSDKRVTQMVLSNDGLLFGMSSSDRYYALMTGTTALQTVSGPVSFAGRVLVPNVTDWGSAQAVPAYQADSRYVGRGVSAVDFTPLQLGVNKASKQIWASYNDGGGVKYTFAQQAGDYATNPALQAETQRATTIESNLQSSKANLAGDNQFSGNQSVKGSVIVGMGAGWSGSTTSGHERWSNSHLGFGASDNTANTYTGYFQITDLLGSPGDNYSGINMFGYDYAGKRFDWYYSWNGNIQTPKGFVAFQSDLPNMGNYALLSQLPTDPNKIILAWNGYVGAGEQSIPFPRGLSGVDTVIVVCSTQAGGGHASAVINVQGWNNSSVQVHASWFDGRGAGDADTNYRAIVIGNK